MELSFSLFSYCHKKKSTLEAEKVCRLNTRGRCDLFTMTPRPEPFSCRRRPDAHSHSFLIMPFSHNLILGMFVDLSIGWIVLCIFCTVYL
ncbi:hypothetical protein BVRB_7g172380 [Beta vulgaris subsp. vulgaris]|nr:hypothetical protein BVRB_7g172380 [Beta vulgaris subsp. vulgaris]